MAFSWYLSHIILGSSIKQIKKVQKLLRKRGDTKDLVSNRNSIEPFCILRTLGAYIHSILGIEDDTFTLIGWCTSVSCPFEQSCYCLSSIRATRAFSMATHFFAHFLVAWILSIYLCVCFLCHHSYWSICFTLQFGESSSTFSTSWTNIFLNFVPLVLTKPLDKLYFVGVSEQVWYQFHYSLNSHCVTRDTSSTLGKR